MSFTKYRHKYKEYAERHKDVKTHNCDCGRPSVKYKDSHHVCAVCLRIEEMMYGGHGCKHSGFDFAMNMTFQESNSIEQYKFHVPKHWQKSYITGETV